MTSTEIPGAHLASWNTSLCLQEAQALMIRSREVFERGMENGYPTLGSYSEAHIRAAAVLADLAAVYVQVAIVRRPLPPYGAQTH